jgi:hypothetical protein
VITDDGVTGEPSATLDETLDQTLDVISDFLEEMGDGLAPPTLEAPDLTSSAMGPAFQVMGDGVNERWDFKVQYATDEEFADIVCDSEWYNIGYHLGSSWVLPGDIGYGANCSLPETGTYYWRARMRDRNDHDAASGWSGTSSFEWLG